MANLTKSVDGVAVELTDEEQAQLEAEAKAWNDAAPARAWASLRIERNKKLAETDWMANSDYTMSDAWKEYRKKLRELPENTDNPESPTWPTKPS